MVTSPAAGWARLHLHAPVDHLRIGEDLRQVVDRAAGHAGGLERGEPLRAGRVASRSEIIATICSRWRHALRVGREALVARPLRAPRTRQNARTARRCRRATMRNSSARRNTWYGTMFMVRIAHARGRLPETK
jgi:hypothetical protein